MIEIMIIRLTVGDNYSYLQRLFLYIDVLSILLSKIRVTVFE